MTTNPTTIPTLVYRPISSLIRNAKNARKHPDSQLEHLQKSIKTAGFVVPVLIDAGRNVIAGHGRLEAAVRLGIVDVPTVMVDHLTPERVRTLAIADNSLGDRSDWDAAILQAELRTLEPADIVGFTDTELDAILKPAAIPTDSGVNLDVDIAQAVEMVTCKNCKKEYPV